MRWARKAGFGREEGREGREGGRRKESSGECQARLILICIAQLNRADDTFQKHWTTVVKKERKL